MAALVTQVPKKCKIIIIGAGMAGLSAANHLIKNGLTDFVVLEARKRIGGRIVSIKLGFNIASYAALYSGWDTYFRAPVKEVRRARGLLSLHNIRVIIDSMFLHKLANGTVDCPEPLGRLGFYVPSHRSRLQWVFKMLHHSTTYEQQSVIPCLMRIGNMYCGLVDIFNTSSTPYKKTLKILLAEDINHF